MAETSPLRSLLHSLPAAKLLQIRTQQAVQLRSRHAGRSIDPNNRRSFFWRRFRNFFRVAKTHGRNRGEVRWDVQLSLRLIRPQPQHRRANPAGTQPSRMGRQHQVLTRPTAVIYTTRNEDQDRCIPKDLEARPFKPTQARLSGPILGFCMVHCGRTERRDSLDTLHNIENPRNLTAKRWWRLGSIPNYAFNKMLFHWPCYIRSYRSTLMNRFDNIHLDLLRVWIAIE